MRHLPDIVQVVAMTTSSTSRATLPRSFNIVVGCALLWALFFRQAPPVSARGPNVTDIKEVIPAADITNVRGSGQIAIVEFSDFQCPFCARHARETVPEVMKEFGEEVRYITLNLPLDIHPQAVRAAEVAECAAAQEKHWEMRILLFERQNDLATADFGAYGKEIGLDTVRFESCLTMNERLSKVQADKALADRLQATGTPTLLIGRMRPDGGIDLRKRINGAAPFSLIRKELSKFQKSTA